ncbi:NAD(P)H-dependent oxidoreductase [Lichenihabitans psoromatis]|uniref:NAD(P)H-dependent oxidoreductase n=1 Tax=Lichenihabitans psoromatis TaxID=2528642 RepID=UPI0010385C61|nr:NAD(P)H-dependent oxidoreductase [Lichenihabitans psoromatis]
MNVLVVYAHPVDTSFVGGLHHTVVTRLERAGHTVDDCDLYAEGFDPVMSRQDRIDYHDTGLNQSRIGPHVERLRRADALVLIYPVWNFGFPAILKGYLDRVWVPGVAFELAENGDLSFTLRHIKKLAAVCTYGGQWWRARLMSDPPRRCVTRMMRAHVALTASTDYLACYDMNHTTEAKRAVFMSRVDATFSRWR